MRWSIAQAARRSLEQSLQEAMEEIDRCVEDEDDAGWIVALTRAAKLEEMLEAMQ